MLHGTLADERYMTVPLHGDSSSTCFKVACSLLLLSVSHQVKTNAKNLPETLSITNPWVSEKEGEAVDDSHLEFSTSPFRCLLN